ncbi:MAG: mRNA surveillance protein pelota [Promethearchaeota archaeon]
MKILSHNRKKGAIKVQVENLNDLWVLYNVVQPGDQLEGRTVRRVVLREGEKGERKPMFLGIRVEGVSFHESTARLRIKGPIYAGPDEFVSMGRYHTFNVELGSVVAILKPEWRNYQVRRLREATRPVSDTRLLVVAIDKGEATLGVVTNYSTTIAAQVNHPIPGKRYEQFDRRAVKGALKEFYEQVTRVLLQLVGQGPVDLLVLAGPGHVKERYAGFLSKEQPELAAKARLVNASSALESAIHEVVRSDAVNEMAKEQRVVVETRLVEEFLRRVGKDEGTAAYGFDRVKEAAEVGAVEKVLVSDVQFRGTDSETQERLDQLLHEVERTGGEVWVLSSMHPAGEQLVDFGGVAALLRFRLDYS